MHELLTEIEIDAPDWLVWDVLVDVARYPAWNPYLLRVEGTLAVGSRLKVESHAGGNRPGTFAPRLLVIEPRRELRWIGSFLVPGLIDGTHRFVLAPLGPAAVRFTQAEVWRGPAAPLHRRYWLPGLRVGFEGMNRALKQRAEQLFKAGGFQPS